MKFLIKYQYKIFVVLWLILIFYFSSHTAEESNKLSKGISKEVIRISEIENKNLRELNTIIRKTAHFSNYAILSILVYLEQNKRQKKNRLFILLFCLFIASCDEYYQKFVPGRESKLSDVFIDFSGSLFGLILIETFYKLRSFKRKDRNVSN